jgi:large subunit ribosomal protein L22
MIKKNLNKTEIKIKSHLYSVKSSDRKIRAFGKLLIGKKISTLLLLLTVQPSKTALTFLKLIKSTIKSKKFGETDTEKVFLRQVSIDKGQSRKKVLTRSQGRTNYIVKKTSHISIIITN